MDKYLCVLALILMVGCSSQESSDVVVAHNYSHQYDKSHTDQEQRAEAEYRYYNVRFNIEGQLEWCCPKCGRYFDDKSVANPYYCERWH